MKLNSSHVFSQGISQVFHSIFTCFYPIVGGGRKGRSTLTSGFLRIIISFLKFKQMIFKLHLCCFTRNGKTATSWTNQSDYLYFVARWVDTLTSNSKLCYNDISVDKQMSLYYSTFTYNLQSQTKTLNHFGKISLGSVFPSPLRCSGKGKCISASRIFIEDCSFHQQLMTIFCFYFFSEEILR